MSPARRLIPFDLLVEAVCEAAGEDVSDVFTRSRRRDLVTARRAIVLLARVRAEADRTRREEAA